MTEEEIEKCRKVVMEDKNWIRQMFEYFKKYKGESKWLSIQSKPVIAENYLKTIVCNRSRFDSSSVLKNLPKCVEKWIQLKRPQDWFLQEVLKVFPMRKKKK